MPVRSLCVTCGLCCDGSLFSYVPLRDSEATALEKRSLRVVVRPEGEPGLDQPCSALEGTTCTLYDDRPSACREYCCRLYDAVESDEVSLDDARALVREARTLVARVDARTPVRRYPFVTFTAAERSRPLDRARRIERAGELDRETRAVWAAAEKHLDRHFRARVGAHRR